MCALPISIKVLRNWLSAALSHVAISVSTYHACCLLCPATSRMSLRPFNRERGKAHLRLRRRPKRVRQLLDGIFDLGRRVSGEAHQETGPGIA